MLNLRDHTPLSGGQVDDAPFGGGAGMVLRVDVLEARCAPTTARTRELRAPARDRAQPDGRLLDDALVEGFARGRADAPVRALRGIRRAHPRAPRTDVISVGRYVLTGGELAAMVCADAILRKLPGALGHPDSAIEESFSEALEGLPEYPHTPARPSFAAGAYPTSCCPGTTRRSAVGVWSEPASGAPDAGAGRAPESGGRPRAWPPGAAAAERRTGERRAR